MTYRAMVELSTSPSLLDRIAACLATFHTPTPRSVAQENIWRLGSTPGWAEAWQFAVDNYNINQNPDLGARNDVITDDMIRDGCAAIHQAAAAQEEQRAQVSGSRARDTEDQDALDRETRPAPEAEPTLVEHPGFPPGQAPEPL